MASVRISAAGGAVEALLRRVVADLEHPVAGDGLDVDVGGGRDLAGDVDLTSGDQRLDGDPALRVFLEQSVEDGVGDRVGDLVRVALSDGFRSEQATRQRISLAAAFGPTCGHGESGGCGYSAQLDVKSMPDLRGPALGHARDVTYVSVSGHYADL